MKILIFTDAWKPQINGVARTYEALAHDLETLGHEVRVVSPDMFKIRLPLKKYGLELAIPMPGELAEKIGDFAPDAIHIATEGPIGWTARQYCLDNAYPFTTSYCTHFHLFAARNAPGFLKNIFGDAAMNICLGGPVLACMREFHRPAAKIIAASEKLAGEIRALGIENETHVIGRGVDTDLFRPGEKTLFAGLPKPVSLYVGRVSDEKNIGAFLDMETAGSKVVVGDGSQLEALKQRYGDSVLFVGAKEGEELAAHFRSADVFVFPSRFDTFGRVMAEAMAAGLPVVAYPEAAAPIIVKDERFGALDQDLKIAFDRVVAGLDRSDSLAGLRHERALAEFATMPVARRFIEGQIPICEMADAA